MNDDPLFSRTFSADQKIVLEDELRSCNALIALYHDQYKTLNGLKKHRLNDFLAMLLKNHLPESDMNVGNVIIPKEHASQIAKVNQIRWDLICAHSRLIVKLANKWHNITSDKSISAEDLQNEAMQAAVYCAVYYSDKERYSTFVYHCINRHLSKVCCRTNGLSKLSQKSVKLKQRYQKLRLEEGSTFDGTVEKMGLSQREIKNLRHSLVRLDSASDLPNEKSFLAVDNGNSSEYCGVKVEELIANLDLTELERAVLEGFMTSSTGKLGLGDSCKGLINPKTNKPYTRMSYTYAWQRIKKKIAEAYSKAA